MDICQKAIGEIETWSNPRGCSSGPGLRSSRRGRGTSEHRRCQTRCLKMKGIKKAVILEISEIKINFKNKK